MNPITYNKVISEFMFKLFFNLIFVYNKQRHMSDDEIKDKLNLNNEDLNYLIYLKNRIEPISKKDEEEYSKYDLNMFRDNLFLSLYNLIYDYNFSYINAKKFSNYLIKNKKIKTILDFPVKEKICGITIFLSPDNYFLKHNFKSYFKEKFHNLKFNINFINNITDLNNEILERNCIIIDISNIDNVMSYFLGKNKNNKNIILISQYLIDNPILKRDFKFSFFNVDKKASFFYEKVFSERIKFICDNLIYS